MSLPTTTLSTNKMSVKFDMLGMKDMIDGHMKHTMLLSQNSTTGFANFLRPIPEVIFKGNWHYNAHWGKLLSIFFFNPICTNIYVSKVARDWGKVLWVHGKKLQETVNRISVRQLLQAFA